MNKQRFALEGSWEFFYKSDRHHGLEISTGTDVAGGQDRVNALDVDTIVKN